MLVILVRHGEAVNESADPLRPLSERGIAQSLATGSALGAFLAAEFEGRHMKIMHSPKKRAMETARNLAKGVRKNARSNVDLVESLGLLPADAPVFWADRLEETAITAPDTPVILVGHLPHLCRLAGLLVTGEPRSFLNVTPASAICLERQESGFWSLNWFITPEYLEATQGQTSSGDRQNG